MQPMKFVTSTQHGHDERWFWAGRPSLNQAREILRHKAYATFSPDTKHSSSSEYSLMTRTNEILEIVSYSIMQHTYLWCGSIRRRSCDDRQWHFEGWPIMKIVVARLGGISNNNRDMHFLHLIHWNRAVCIEKCDPGIMPWRCNYHSIKNFPVSIACANPPLRMWRRRRRRWSQMQQSCYIATKARSNR